MANLDVWMESDQWGDDGNTINWHVGDVPFDLNRFHHDQRYANLVNQHVRNSIEHLARELAEIDLYTPQTDEYDWTNCE